MSQLRKGILHYLWDVERGPYGLLFVTIFLVFMTSPLVSLGLLNHVIADAFVIVFMITGVITVRPRPAVRYLVLVLLVMAMIAEIAAKILHRTEIMIGQALIEATEVGLFAALVIKQFLVSGRTASNRIGGAIVVYLLVGILWSRFYYAAELMIPGAFHSPDGITTITSYVYFSFVTLATIGYGDISPIHPVVRNLAVLEAITGQMYIAILIAWLVSTAKSNEKYP
jgi:hypothetical protein